MLVARLLGTGLAVLACSLAASTFAGVPDLPYDETFDGTDGVPWPSPWFIVTPNVTVADVQGDRGRLGSLPGTVGRMTLPGFADTDVEVEVTVTFEDVDLQGFGFYVRQNGGYLQDTMPHGEGYAMFLKGAWAWPEDLGIWHELDGQEIQFDQAYDPIPGGLQNGVPYRLRFRVTQETPTSTAIHAKVWPASNAEPLDWTIETTGTAPVLQGTPGAFAADVYHAAGSAHIFLDDLSIRPFPDPTAVPEAPRSGALRLSAPRPNPMRGSAVFAVESDAGGFVRMRVVDVAGRSVAALFSGVLEPGHVVVPWNGTSDAGAPLASGVYFVTLESAASRTAQRFVIRR